MNVFWSMTGSPMTQWPNTNMVRKALEKIPFVITVDEYLTSTALYSDLVLPAQASSRWTACWPRTAPIGFS